MNINEFNPNDYPSDLRGWDSQAPIFREVIEEVKPKVIIEVGSWLGASAIHMASICEELNTTILCVDTWLGSLEMWLYPHDPEHQSDALKLKFGYPQLYYTFLSNITRAGYQSKIIPYPMTSRIAAQYFTYHNFKADLIYIDASHDYKSVKDDLYAYWPLLNDNGILFGDDYTWNSVQLAVHHFSDSISRVVTGTQRHYIIRK